MIGKRDAADVADALGKNLQGVANNQANFEGLPDTFWGYYAKGHSGSGSFGVFVAYSEDDADINGLIKIYEEWAARNRSETD
ncbi:hypothetical protein CENSYa_1709 [Cenarchaeum symbiosum A]|uniref:Uncharacterized protein n=1 Tax=Cenarchaeum symbiosum (strain A) TaxID=414004 RepID=A0RYA6_CENSY|nr:hypothetical protein CENSYa_1709 [Cenarchaeum symbiosum A]